MQNFTLGKKGISMLFFAFFLLIGSSPSFGQACPTVNSTPPSFCYLDNINDLTAATGGDSEVVWYRDEAMTQPIPSNEFLEDNKTYYAGNAEGNCTTPTPVTVTVDTIPAPVSQYGTVYSPYLESETSTRDIGDLTEAINTTEGGAIIVYTAEYGTESYVESDELTAGQSYFVGQTSTATCEFSFRIAIRYSPDVAPAPDAQSPQTFCEGATVADLEATGIEDTQAFRWYSTATSNPALDEDEELISGTYFVSQIVNDEGFPSPPVESEARTAVEVTIQPATFNESTQRFCESIGEGNDFRTPEVQDLSPAGEWYADDSFTTPLDPNTELVNGKEYYQRSSTECEVLVVTAEFFSTPNAGSTTSVPVCSNDEPFNLVDEINNSIIGPPQQTGTFSPALSTGTNIFNPAEYEPGSYTFRYIVEGNEDCPTDESRITVVIEEAPNAGEDVDEIICSSEINNAIEIAQEYASYLENRDLSGTFDNDATPEIETYSLEELAVALAGQYQDAPFIPFSYTYTVGEEGECQDSAQIKLVILESPDAGEDAIITLSEEGSDPINLFDRLGGTPDGDGTWSNGDGIFNPETDTPGDFVYTVTDSVNGCEDTATVTVQGDCPEVIANTQRFCESIGEGNDFDRPRVRNLESSLDNPTWFADETLTQELDPETLLVDEEEYFSSDSSGCIIENVSVELFDTPNAGSTTSVTVCAIDEPFDLVDFIRDSQLGAPDRNGIFIPALASGTTIFDPSVDEARQYIYRVEGNENCDTDDSRITVNITEPTNANAGEDVEANYCSNEGVIDLYTLVPEGVNATGIFDGYENGQFDTSANIGLNEIIYTVDDEEGCVIAGSATYFITVFEAPNAGPGADLNYCITDIQQMSPEEALAIFENLIPDNVTEGGDFSTSINDLIIQFTTNPIGEFSTTYSVSNENCSDSATYSVKISDTENADAGSDVDNLVFCSTDADVNLNNFLSDDALQNGYFEELENGVFSPSTAGVGTFNFTFIVDSSSDCVTGSDSAIYTIEVLQGPDAGENGSVTLSTSDDAVNLFAYLNGTPEEGGLWSPGNSDGDIDPSQYEEGQFDFTYTVVSENECEASATVTVTITEDEIICPVVTQTEQAFCESIGEGNDFRLPRVSDLMPSNATWYDTADSDAPLALTTVLINGEDYFAGNEDGTCATRGRVVVTLDDSPNAGRTTNITVCAEDEPFDLLEKINPSILGAPDAGGTFSPALASGTTIFDPSVDAARQYIYTVVSTNEVCPDDEARITVNILPNEVANAGDDLTLNFCVDDADVNLFDELEDGVTMGGRFEGYPDGTFSPSTLGEGTYTVTYNVGADLPCITGTSSSTITITVTSTPNAPVADANQSFCLIDNPTVADITVTGENVIIFQDEALTEEATGTNPLANDAVYYAVATTGDNGCNSEPVMITISLTDGTAPTLQAQGNEFCRSDNPTIQDLINNLSGSGIQIYQASTGGTALATSTALVDGTTYFASGTDSTSQCESSERTAVQAEVAFCGIPEAFSPNGDNINDRFVIPDIAIDFPNYTIEIFNRWGNVVFKGNSSTGDWDGVSNQSGTLGDNVLAAGVYFYILNYNDGQTAPIQGKVYLSR